MADVRGRLAKSLARVEALTKRNTEQRERIRKAAAGMADAATAFTRTNEAKALAGDPDAVLHHYRALSGRYRARQLAGSRDDE